MEKLIKQIMKFGVVGGSAFVIDYGIMIFLTEVFHINYLISSGISFAAGRQPVMAYAFEKPLIMMT